MRLSPFLMLPLAASVAGCLTSSRPEATPVASDDTPEVTSTDAEAADVEEADAGATDAAAPDGGADSAGPDSADPPLDTADATAVEDLVEDTGGPVCQTSAECDDDNACTVDECAPGTSRCTHVAASTTTTCVLGQSDACAGGVRHEPDHCDGQGQCVDGGQTACTSTSACAVGQCDAAGQHCVLVPVGEAAPLAGDWFFVHTHVRPPPNALIPAVSVSGVMSAATSGQWSLANLVRSVDAGDPPLSGSLCKHSDRGVTFAPGNPSIAPFAGMVDADGKVLALIEQDAATLIVALRRAGTLTPPLGTRYRITGLVPKAGGGLAGIAGWIGFDATNCVSTLSYATSEGGNSDASILGLGVGTGNCAVITAGGLVSLSGTTTPAAGQAASIGDWKGQLAAGGSVALLRRHISPETIFPGFLLLVREDANASAAKLPGTYALVGLDASTAAPTSRWGSITYVALGAAVQSFSFEDSSGESHTGGGTANDWYQVTALSSQGGLGMYRHNLSLGPLAHRAAGQTGPLTSTLDGVSLVVHWPIPQNGEPTSFPNVPALTIAFRKP